MIAWWARPDSNQRPIGYEPTALTTELRARCRQASPATTLCHRGQYTLLRGPRQPHPRPKAPALPGCGGRHGHGGKGRERVRRWGAERRLPAGAGTAHLLPREPRCPGRGAQQWVRREAKVRGGRCAVKRARSARALSPRWAAAGGSTGGEWLGERPPVAEGGPPEERREGTHTSRGTHGCKCSAGGTVANLQT